MWMPCSERKYPIVFGGGERSSVVTGVQTPNTLVTKYVKLGSLDTSHGVAFNPSENPYEFFRCQRSTEVTRGQNAKFPKISQGQI